MLVQPIGPDAAGLRHEISRLNERLAEELQAANRKIGAKVSGDARRILNEKVYSVEIPLKKRVPATVQAKHRGTSRQTVGGAAVRRWRRSGQLLAEESYVLSKDKIGSPAVILINRKAYAVYRDDLGRPGHRQSGEQSGKSPTREVHWQEEAVKQNLDFIRETYEGALSRALERTVKLR